MLKAFAAMLAKTQASLLIQDVAWIVPTVQTVHILAVAMIMSSVAMIDLRIFGMAGGRTTISDTARRYVPWVWGALAVLTITGAILVVGEPDRSITNAVFQLKMLMLIVAVGVTAVFQITVRRNARFWDLEPAHGRYAKVFALATFALWLAIAVAGRWIAYAADAANG